MPHEDKVLARQKAMGYLDLKTTRTLRLLSPCAEGLSIIASTGNPDYPPAGIRKAVLKISPPTEGKPVCVLIGRCPTQGGPAFYTNPNVIGLLIHTALDIYAEADQRNGSSSRKLPQILANLNPALHDAGLPSITSDTPGIGIMALLPGQFVSRLAGLMVFRQKKDGVYCSVTNASSNPVSVAMTPSFIDFSAVACVSAGSWQL